MLEILSWGLALLIVLIGLLPVFIVRSSSSAGPGLKSLTSVVGWCAFLGAGAMLIAVNMQVSEMRAQQEAAQAKIEAAQGAIDALRLH